MNIYCIRYYNFKEVKKGKGFQAFLNIFRISITFNNPLKVCFSNMKYLITIQTRPKPIVKSIFLFEKSISNEFLKVIISVQNH